MGYKSFLCGILTFFCFGATDVQAADKLRLGTLPAADSIILYTAKADGVFAKYGLDVEVLPFQSALELGAAMRSGSLDGHFGDIINVLMQNENGVPQVIVATTSHSAQSSRFFGLALSPKATAKSLDELKGRSCAIGRATIVEFVLDSLLEQERKAELIEKRDIRQIPIRLQMMLSGQIDAALLPEPLLSLVEGQGAHILIDDSKLDLPLAVIALKKPEAGADAAFTDMVKRFRAALAEEAERINADPVAYKAKMIECKLLSPKAAQHYTMLRFDGQNTPLGLPSEADLRRYADWMEKNRILKKGMPALSDIVFHDKD